MLSESYAGLMKLFKMLDTDGNGVISLQELKYELALFGMNEDQISRFMHEFDLNGDQQITLEEFKLRLNIPSSERTSEEKRLPHIRITMTPPMRSYRRTDVRISFEEKRKEISELGLKNHTGLIKLFNMLDTDRNGVISLMELKNELPLFGFNEEQVSRFLHEFDLNGDQQITLEEYKLRLKIPLEGFEEAENAKRLPHKKGLVPLTTNSVCIIEEQKNPEKMRREISELGLESYSGLMKLFDLIDTEGDGVISIMELKIELALFGLNEKEIWRFLQDLDLMDEEEVTVEEYKQRLHIFFGGLKV